MASRYEDTATAGASHRWEEAGEAWGSRAIDWSCLYEHYSLDMLVALLPRLGVGPGTSLLDVACGSGLAVRVADGMGAEVAGIDAAAELVAVACDRTPTADLRVGSMFELPWADGRFDAVMSVNGIWGGCGEALDEIHRVLRAGRAGGHQLLGPGPTPGHPRGVQGLCVSRSRAAPRIDATSQQHRRAGRGRGDVGGERFLGARARWPRLDDGMAGRGHSVAGVIQRGTGGPGAARERLGGLTRRPARRTRAVSGFAWGVPHPQRPPVPRGEKAAVTYRVDEVRTDARCARETLGSEHPVAHRFLEAGCLGLAQEAIGPALLGLPQHRLGTVPALGSQ